MQLEELILRTLKEEVVPAMGCTDPVAVALACAKAMELVNHKEIISLDIWLSPNIYKNGLAVGIPNTNEVGLHIASALGAMGGRSEKGLEVLEGITDKEIELANKLIESDRISINIKDTTEKIYIEVKLYTEKGYSIVIIQNKHNEFVYLETDKKIILNKIQTDNENIKSINPLYELNIKDIISEIERIDYEKLSFMLEGLEMNEKIAMAGLSKKSGMSVGLTIYENVQKGILADDLMNGAMMLTAAGADARMSGINMPVMSSNGSGNNGLTAILPILAYHKKFSVDNEKLARAIAISHILNSYIKHYIGRLSALCGCGVAAATGASVAIAWLMGAKEQQIDAVVKNMLANISGMICDGAKVGCALKLATSASAAIQSALLALNDQVVPNKNGMIANTAEDTIRNLGILSEEGMNLTDHVILKVMRQMEA
ncbi:L-serine ammonia-lyase, iron-sulfur-dependent, subunit alpha [Alkaliphilus sp. MSJ-5]|uniref:UPF0597 protein KQI88_11605 n=1 Tax=Alkaliphilus flagellatus TaxID=2841507 RepID=A0ABS6G6P5_9FIRM|nr:L-serine ammonia-lyase, iron-sulfur-dependent, subunit alpha [Alkaliphilus flagellatus]MBU5677056.1 L-serine ammonia-lyase, iron-sulfur-dependent, subunit alpha [Alkaliphilus flagellatus]